MNKEIGRLITSFAFEGQFSISTENYPNGLFFCEIWNGNHKITVQKLAIIH